MGCRSSDPRVATHERTTEPAGRGRRSRHCRVRPRMGCRVGCGTGSSRGTPGRDARRSDHVDAVRRRGGAVDRGCRRHRRRLGIGTYRPSRNRPRRGMGHAVRVGGDRVPGPLPLRRIIGESPAAMARVGSGGRRDHRRGLARARGDRRFPTARGPRRRRRQRPRALLPRGRHLRRHGPDDRAASRSHDRGRRAGGTRRSHLPARGDRVGSRADDQRPEGARLVDDRRRGRGSARDPARHRLEEVANQRVYGERRRARRAAADVRWTHVTRRAARRAPPAARRIAPQEPGTLSRRGLDGNRRRTRLRRLRAEPRTREDQTLRPTSWRSCRARTCRATPGYRSGSRSCWRNGAGA